MPERERPRSFPDGSSTHGRDVLGCTTALVNATAIGACDPLATPLPNDLLDQLPGGAFVFNMVPA